MDNKAFGAELRAVWPTLKKEGFDRFSSRSGWREHADRIDVVSFQSLAKYTAFAIEVGCYFKYIPGWVGPVNFTDGKPSPNPPDCPMRGRLRRGYFEFMSADRTLWSLGTEGQKAPKAFGDARNVVIDAGLPWFARFDSPRKVFELLAIQKDQDMETLWGFGEPGSPARFYLLGYAARAAGLQAEARDNLLKAAETPTYANASSRLAADAESA